MPDPALLKELLRRLQSGFRNLTEPYRAAIDAAAAAGKPLPCCNCFCAGMEAPLEQLPVKGGFGAVTCGRCKARFAYMSAEHQEAPGADS